MSESNIKRGVPLEPAKPCANRACVCLLLRYFLVAGNFQYYSFYTLFYSQHLAQHVFAHCTRAAVAPRMMGLAGKEWTVGRLAAMYVICTNGGRLGRPLWLAMPVH